MVSYYKLGNALSKRLYKYFIYATIKNHYRGRGHDLCRKLNCKPLTEKQKKEIKKYYASFGFHDVDCSWHQFYTHMSGQFHKDYIPVDFYLNHIEHKLNMKEMYPALTDKNLLDLLFAKIKQPETIFKNINGLLVDGHTRTLIDFEYALKKCLKYDKLIIKPSIESGGGRNIQIIQISDRDYPSNMLKIKETIDRYKNNYIIQKFENQHASMSLLNPSSLNTIRIQSFIHENEVHILVSFVRIGGINSVVDNVSSGGIFATISNGGIINSDGYNSDGKTFKRTESGIVLNGYKIPGYNPAIKDIKRLHSEMPHFKIISWDIGISETLEPILIECNVFTQYIDHQFVSGQPLFGNMTSDILEMCKAFSFWEN